MGFFLRTQGTLGKKSKSPTPALPEGGEGEERDLPFLPCGVEAGDAAERGRAADAVLAEAAR